MVNIHIINFMLWSITYGVYCFGFSTKLINEKGTWIQFGFHLSLILQDLAITYLDIFLMYLVVAFANETKVAGKQDKLLQKQVPNIVLLMNKQLLKKKLQTTENER